MSGSGPKFSFSCDAFARHSLLENEPGVCVIKHDHCLRLIKQRCLAVFDTSF